MIVVTVATGRTGRRVTEMLLAKGEKVRAVGRSAKKLSPLAELGAEPFVGTVEDVRCLMEAFTGAAGVYLVLPEDLSQQDLPGAPRFLREALGALFCLFVPVTLTIPGIN